MIFAREGITFDDVLLVPNYSEIESRSEVDISSHVVDEVKIDIPIISANMPSVTGTDMAIKMSDIGCFGVLHRFNTIEEAVENAKYVHKTGAWFGVSLGIHDGIERAIALYPYTRYFFVDVAHGHMRTAIRFVDKLKREFYSSPIKIIAGNVATYEAAMDLIQAGADGIKIGIGPGAACTTREVTGFGVPQLTAISDVAQVKDTSDVKLIADGGIKNSGDIVKALAAGADTVMIGRLLAGSSEAPHPGVYYGNASQYVNKHNAPEGVFGKVERTGPVEHLIKKFKWGIKSGLSYAGAHNIKELQENARWIRISHGAVSENATRL